MSNPSARFVIVVIVCLLAAILGKLWQLERAIERAESTTSCAR